MKTARVALFEGTPGRIVIREFPIPRPTAGETLVRVRACTLCGSDLHSFEGRRSVPIPTILGHEIVGEIVAQGAGAPRLDLAGTPLNVGDLVTWAIVAHCGECYFCLRDLPQKCLQGVKYGHEPLRNERSLNGGLADYCLLVAGTSLMRVPESLEPGVAAPASCATATIAAACEAAGELQGRNVAISGAGMLGLTACAMARSLGAAEVHCVEPSSVRRGLIEQFGGTPHESATELGGRLQELAGPHGFDVILELSGNTRAVEAALPMLRIGGTLVLVGAVFPGPAAAIVPEQLVRRQLSLRGVHNYAPRHLARGVQFLATAGPRYPFADLVSEWVPLEEVVRAFELARDPGQIRMGVGSGVWQN